jgi:hypothetical protein
VGGVGTVGFTSLKIFFYQLDEQFNHEHLLLKKVLTILKLQKCQIIQLKIYLLCYWRLHLLESSLCINDDWSLSETRKK